MNLAERVVAARTGGGTERCHGIRHVGSYSNAQHSWGVAMLLMQLWPEHAAVLLPHAIAHDVPEGWVGDIPMPTKRFSKDVKNAVIAMETEIFRRLELPSEHDIPEHLYHIFKSADQLELWLWCKEQVSFGNMHVECVIRELETYWTEKPLAHPGPQLVEYYRTRPVVHSTDALIREINT